MKLHHMRGFEVEGLSRTRIHSPQDGRRAIKAGKRNRRTQVYFTMLVAKLETKTEFHGRVHSTTRPTEISSCGFETAISTDAIVPAYPPDRKGGFKEVQDATLVLVAISPGLVSVPCAFCHGWSSVGQALPLALVPLPHILLLLLHAASLPASVVRFPFYVVFRCFRTARRKSPLPRCSR